MPTSLAAPSPAGGSLDQIYLDRIKQIEGFEPRAKWDYSQYSNGYGTKAKYAGEPIDPQTADSRFQDEMWQATKAVDDRFPNLPAGPRAALASLTYNAGPRWMNGKLGTAVENGDWNQARAEMMQYTRAGGKVLPGLVNRRTEEASWFNNPPSEANGQSPAGGIPRGAGGGAPYAMPPYPGTGGPQTMNGGGGFAGALGISPNAWGQTAAALGKGLSAVGAQRPGTFGAASFAAGMGGALTGGVEEANKQQEQARQAWRDTLLANHQFFGDTIAGFRAELEGEAFPYKLGEMQARINWETSRAIASGANPALAKASASWRMSDVGRMKQALDQANTEYKAWLSGRQDLLRAGTDLKPMSEEDMEKKQEQFRQNNYTRFGVDPKTAKGLSKDNAIDVTGKSDEEMQTMPQGTHYKYKDPKDPKADKDGYVHKFRYAPPAPTPASPGTPGGTTAGDMDDYLIANSAPPQS